MEPVTHILTGACIARAGCNRRAAYATLTMAVAAEFPDIDTLWALRGPIAGFQHHRGITHTLVGIPVEAGIIVAAIYALHRFRVRRAAHQTEPRRKPLTHAPVRWGLLYVFALAALFSHLLLDYSNNYGLRLFFPFIPHWYAGSFVFIFDPLIFLLLLMAFVMPLLFGLINNEVGARRQPFRGSGWAKTALVCILGVWCLRAVEHARAVQLAGAQSMTINRADAPPEFLQPLRVLANPDPLSPFRWHMVSDFGNFYQLGEADLLSGVLTPAQDIHPKPEASAALTAAEASALGRVYMDWSPMPFISVSPPGDPARLADASEEPGSIANTLVIFRDPRFMIDVPLLRSRRNPPLTGEVEVDPQNHVVRQTMDGNVEPRN
jgi:inner membrane protein